ncbi:MAG: DUF6178 family protein [Proteobacteria bacterium]|nr:DUF6178 family protein [Pseudomonadota bacterium]
MTKKNSPDQRLLPALLEDPALPAYIEALPPPILKRLIDTIGINDAGDIIALASASQLASVLDESIWQNAAPGEPELLNPLEVLRWLDVLNDQGASVVADRLYELGEEFVLAAFAKLVNVGFAVGDPPRDGYSMVLEPFLVSSFYEDEWASLEYTLVALYNDYPRFLLRVFDRLVDEESMLSTGDARRTVNVDAQAEREIRRTAAGYVTSESAAQFLETAANTALEELVASSEYDLITRRCFMFARSGAPASRSGAGSTFNAPDNAPDETSDDPPSEQSSVAAAAASFSGLDNLLRSHEILGAGPVALLTAPASGRSSRLLTLLDDLGDRFPQALNDRGIELAYLSNVLISGTQLQGERLDERAAAEIVIATADLGLDYIAATETVTDSTQTWLTRAPGVVRLFGVGWNLLQTIPVITARHVINVLEGSVVSKRLQSKPWIAEEIRAACRNPDFVETVAAGRFAEAHEALYLMSLILDQQVCAALRVLIDDLPRMPGLFDPVRPSADAAPRLINALADFEAVSRLIHTLPASASL